jgi:hypothetical protein
MEDYDGGWVGFGAGGVGGEAISTGGRELCFARLCWRRIRVFSFRGHQGCDYFSSVSALSKERRAWKSTCVADRGP